jgi:hypothetical protein
MDPAKVAMLCVSAALYDLPPKLKRLADDEGWWAKLEDTPEDRLDDEQKAMIAALGVDLGER